jgi:hypothetical protein
MNYFDLPEYASLSPFESVAVRSPADDHDAAVTRPAFDRGESATPLERLVAKFHRRAVAPRGYRYVANLGATDLERALLAIKYGSGDGELRLVTPAVDSAGNPVPDFALYVRDHLPDPTSFWLLFHSAAQTNAA